MLEEGGNAVDAAVAAAFAAFVCELPLCSPFGGAAMLVDRPGETPVAFDMFARAPGLGSATPLALDFEDVEVSFGAATQVFHVGRGSAAIPLAMRGLLEAHARFGSMPLERVAAPAVALGRDGYVLNAGIAHVFQILTPIVQRTPECAALFEDGGGEIAGAGARLSNPALATTLETIARRPEHLRDLEASFAEGFGARNGGLVTLRDLEDARIGVHEPVSVRHRDWDVFTMPGPSTGGVLVALGLRLLEGASRAPFLSRDSLLLLARVQELLLAVREDGLDETCRDARAVRRLLSPSRIDDMRAVLDLAPPSSVPPPPDSPLGSTTHVSVIDQHGGCVSLTLTNGEGCGVTLPGTGIVVNNLLGEDDIHPRGFHVDPPGRALATMMAPTILRRGEEVVVLGSGGSNRLRTAILQVLVALVEHGVSPDRAVAAPRLHVEGSGGPARTARIAFESPGLAPEVVRSLIDSYPDAPRVFDLPNLYFGGVHVVLRRNQSFGGAGDARRGGAVAIV